MILRRVVLLVVTFVVILGVTFCVSRLAPGEAMQGDEVATNAAVAEWRALRGADVGLGTQLGRWLIASCSLDFGSSFVDARPVRSLVLESLASTLPLTVAAAFIAYGLGVPLGFLLAVRNRSRLARFVTFALFALHGLPVFVAALLTLIVTGALGLPTPRDNALAVTLAVLCLSYPAVARIARYQRAAVLEVLGSGFVRVARAKGLPERVVLGCYVLRATLVAPVSLLASEIPYLLGGSVIVERIFTLPGMGMLAFESILRRDLPVVMGITALIALVTMASTVLADIVYARADPRRRA